MGKILDRLFFNKCKEARELADKAENVLHQAVMKVEKLRSDDKLGLLREELVRLIIESNHYTALIQKGRLFSTYESCLNDREELDNTLKEINDLLDELFAIKE